MSIPKIINALWQLFYVFLNILSNNFEYNKNRITGFNSLKLLLYYNDIPEIRLPQNATIQQVGIEYGIWFHW